MTTCGSKEQKETEMVLKVDLCCEQCYKKVKKVLCKFPQIRNQVYDEKNNTVTITVLCCSPEKIRDKLCCKGCKYIKSIEIKPPPKPKPPAEPEKPKPPAEPEKPMPPAEPEKSEKPEPEKPEPAPKPPKPVPQCVPMYPPCRPPQMTPVSACCASCYEGMPGGPCYHTGPPGPPYTYVCYCRPWPPPYYGNRCHCFSEANPSACSIM